MHLIEKATLFTEIAEEQCATVTGGDASLDALNQLISQLNGYEAATGNTVIVTTGSNSTSSTTTGSTTTTPAPATARYALPNLVLVSSGNTGTVTLQS